MAAGWTTYASVIDGYAQLFNLGGAAAVLGKVYLVGSPNDSPQPPSIYLWEPSTNVLTVEALIPSNIPAVVQGVAGIGQYIFMSGGPLSQGPYSFSRYDVITKQFSYLPNLLIPRQNHFMVAFGTKLYIGAGYNAVTNSFLTSFQSYDTGTGQWTNLAPVPAISNSGLAVAASLTGIFAANSGGAYKYDFSTGTWGNLPSLPTPVEGGLGFYADTFYVTGGFVSASQTISNTHYRLDPVSNSWQSLLPPTTPVFQSQGAALETSSGFELFLGFGRKINSPATNTSDRQRYGVIPNASASGWALGGASF